MSRKLSIELEYLCYAWSSGGVYIVCNSKTMWYYILDVRVTVVHLNIDENEDFGVEISQDLVKYWKQESVLF